MSPSPPAAPSSPGLLQPRQPRGSPGGDAGEVLIGIVPVGLQRLEHAAELLLVALVDVVADDGQAPSHLAAGAAGSLRQPRPGGGWLGGGRALPVPLLLLQLLHLRHLLPALLSLLPVAVEGVAAEHLLGLLHHLVLCGAGGHREGDSGQGSGGRQRRGPPGAAPHPPCPQRHCHCRPQPAQLQRPLRRRDCGHWCPGARSHLPRALPAGETQQKPDAAVLLPAALPLLHQGSAQHKQRQESAPNPNWRQSSVWCCPPSLSPQCPPAPCPRVAGHSEGRGHITGKGRDKAWGLQPEGSLLAFRNGFLWWLSEEPALCQQSETD